ncbi:nucleotide-binding universal stress UspA family protein [Altererythrobacter atlanticus]|uniref:Universal stress protein F n=1 Tax=Croceibacterium atlanticum TaxID=1267766 RepID=A0A0F7KZN7_9SPHN|nr:universal stress protein [Croceibacterium atlanticum]AKH44320.1 Universal stress protein F [Croceibacterium atlanticum]MBB5733897.1 nucleotide-binding universal stress UspA family protein [Croceibacterium atlanticum]
MYSSILVPIDLDEPSSWQKSVPTALALGRCFDARIALAHVVPESLLTLKGQWSSLSVRRMLDDHRIRLMTLADELAGGARVEAHVTSGSIYDGILQIAAETGADLIVLASHRPQMKDYLIGANAARVVRHARCSVMVVRDQDS